jgi:hypothetical protein
MMSKCLTRQIRTCESAEVARVRLARHKNALAGERGMLDTGDGITRVGRTVVGIVYVDRIVRDAGQRIARVGGAGVIVINIDRCMTDAKYWVASVGGAGIPVVSADW